MALDLLLLVVEMLKASIFSLSFEGSARTTGRVARLLRPF
ncbi:MAG: hypothetical protein DDT34_02216 [Firmicutes bacterium]|nr:hypothetical protein [Bacillota bacterium]